MIRDFKNSAKKSSRESAARESWEIIADNLSKTGWSCGCISSSNHKGRQFWVAAAGQ
jgi:hypothetical protein